MKRLLFAAILATVAVGGATAQIYSLGSVTADINCSGAGTSCSVTYGNVGYSIPAAFPGEKDIQVGSEVNLTVLNRN